MLDAQKSLVDSGSGYPPRLLGKKINKDKCQLMNVVFFVGTRTSDLLL